MARRVIKRVIKRPMASADGSQLGPGGGQLALQMPDKITIGTQRAFENNYAFPYTKQTIDSETVYVCTKGSQWARPSEVLVLRCEHGTWTAYDSALIAGGTTLQCRQPVFRCKGVDITQPGVHTWEINYAANPSGEGHPTEWQGGLQAETRLQ